jgi:hypothetical protein
VYKGFGVSFKLILEIFVLAEVKTLGVKLTLVTSILEGAPRLQSEVALLY